MTSPRPVASKDKLDKFVRSFEKFSELEDLVDTDSESESECESVGRSTSPPVRSRKSNESLEFVDNSLCQSIVFLCIPKLEGALLSSLANAKSAYNVEVRTVCDSPTYLLQTDWNSYPLLVHS